MTLPAIFANLLKPKETWTVTIEIGGETITATAFEENDHGMWHISYEVPGEYKTYRTKWVTPTPEEMRARRESAR